MRSPKPFDTVDGLRWRVRYRQGQTQTSQTFDSDAEATKFCIDLDAYGWERAEQLLYDRLAAVDSGTPTLDTWVAEYIDTLVAAPGTRTKYRRNYELHISPALGTLPIDHITSTDAARLVIDLSERAGLSDKTVANVFGVLSGAMAIAHARGITRANPCAETKMPRRTAHLTEEQTYLTPVEFQLLRSKIDPRFLPLVDFAAGTGARWGECAALTVRDFDLAARRVRINKARKSDGTVGPPKTRRSVRTIDFPAEILPGLLQVVAGKAPGDLAFTMPKGGPLLHRTFSTRYWIPACIAAGLEDPRPGFHSLRHSHASWLLQRGVRIEVVSRRLGHASIAITADVYGHLDPAHAAEAADVAGMVFGPAAELSAERPTLRS